MEVSLKKILRYKASVFKKFNRTRYISRKYFDIPEFKKNPKALKIINNKSFKALNNSISKSTVDIVRDENSLIPLNDKINIKSKKFIIISSKT